VAPVPQPLKRNVSANIMNNTFKTILILLLSSTAFGETIELFPTDNSYSMYLKYAKESYKIDKEVNNIEKIKPIYNSDSTISLFAIGREKTAKVCYIKSKDTTVIEFKNIYFMENVKWINETTIYIRIWVGRIFKYDLYWNTKNNKEIAIQLFLEKPENQK
jgi:hypothetical protein